MNTDEFGGIAVEDVDEFGGVAVAEESVTPAVTQKLQVGMAVPPGQPADFQLLPGGMNDPGDPKSGEFTNALFNEAPGAALTYVGNVARGFVADAAVGIRTLGETKREAIKTSVESSGNLPAAIMGEPLPIDKALSDAASEAAQRGEFPAAATVGQISQGLSAMAPLAAIGLLPATIQRLAALGFSIDMVMHAPELFNDYAEEINKPESEQDPDKIAKLTSGIVQTVTFAPLAGKHGASIVPKGALNPKWDWKTGFSGKPEAFADFLNQAKMELPEGLVEIAQQKSPEVIRLERAGAPLTAKAVEGIKAKEVAPVVETPKPAAKSEPYDPYKAAEEANRGIVEETTTPEANTVADLIRRYEEGDEALSTHRDVATALQDLIDSGKAPKELQVHIDKLNREIEGAREFGVRMDMEGEAGDALIAAMEKSITPAKQVLDKNLAEGESARVTPPLKTQAYQGAPVVQVPAKGKFKTESEAETFMDTFDPNVDPQYRKVGNEWVVYAPEDAKPIRTVEQVKTETQSPTPANVATEGRKVGEEKATLEKELRDADNYAGKLSNEAEKAVQAWAVHVEDVVNPLKKKIREAQMEVSQMQGDASRTKPETPSRNKLTKKAFLEKYGVDSMDAANALYKEKNAAWAKLEEQLEAAESKRKELELAKERRGKEWSSAATKAGELRRQVYPKVKEGDVGGRAKSAQTEKPSPPPPVTEGKGEIVGTTPDKFTPGETVTSERYGQGKVVADMGNRVRVDFGDGNKFAVARNDLTRPKVETPKVEAAPEKVQVGNSPQTHTIVERLKQTETEKANGEQPVRVKNDKTGKESVVMETDTTPIKPGEKIAKPKRNTKSELEAKLREAGLDPSVFPDNASKKNALDRAVAKIEELQKKIRGSRADLQMGVPKAILDLALESARLTLIATNSIAKAVAAAVKYIREKHPGLKIDEAELHTSILERLETESKAAAKSPTMTRPDPQEVKMRSLSERGTTAENIPEPVREQIKTDPASKYETQSLRGVDEAVRAMSDAELAAVGRESNIYTAAKLEQSSRAFADGNDVAGAQIFQELSAELTRMGQVINQAKLLQAIAPQHVVKVVNESLKKAGKDPLTPKQEAAITEAAKERIKATEKLDEVTDTWRKNPSEENAKIAEQTLEDANRKALAEQRLVHRYQNRSMWQLLKAIMQGNLLTPISQVANLVGNMTFRPFMMMSDQILASGFDTLRSYIRNTPREVGTVNPLESFKGAIEASKMIPDILKRGSDEALKGETRVGLHPLRAWANLLAKEPDAPTVGGKLSAMDRTKLFIEGTFGMPAEAMLRGLAAGDQPFRGAARRRLITEQSNLKGVPKDMREMAQKFPEMFFDRATMDRINNESLAAIFQRRSETLNHMLSWIKKKGDAFDFMVATLVPYKVTPWNIVSEILSFTPPVSVGRAIAAARRGDVRTAEHMMGRAVVGGMMIASATWLYKMGLIAPSLDAEDEQQKARLLSGEVMPPNHINISGLKRAMAGGDPAFKPGDDTRDFFRAGGLYGSMLYLAANVGRDTEKNPESSMTGADVIGQGMLQGARFTMNQSFLRGTATLLDAVQEGNADSLVRGWINSLESVPMPNTLNSISKASREFQVDARPQDWVDKLVNPLKQRLGAFGLDDQMTLKRGLWGEPLRETPKDQNAILYHFFDITKGKQVTDDALNLELYRLWRKTANSAVIPTPPKKELQDGGKTYVLTPAQQGDLQEAVGKARRPIAEAIVVNPNFSALPDEEKVDMLQWAYDLGRESGKAQFMSKNPNLTEKGKRSGFSTSTNAPQPRL